MTQRGISAGVLAEAAMLWVLTALAGAADQLPPLNGAQRSHIELFHDGRTTARLFTVDRPVGRSRHRFRLELEGARAQAEDWLHDAGFSLFEDRDAEGRHSYAVISGALAADNWPVVRLRARVGNPQLSAGMRLRRETPALGVTVPWHSYTLEFEGLEDKSLGYLLMGTVHWSNPGDSVQYGIAVPLAVGRGPSVGALLQIRVRIGK